MKKYLNFIGSILFAGYVVPMYSFVANYPQLTIRDTFLIIVLFVTIALGIASFFGIFFRDKDKVFFLIYGISFIFWFSHPISVFVGNNSHIFDFIFRKGIQWPVLYFCCFISAIILYSSLKFCQNFIKRFNQIISIFVIILSSLLLMNGYLKTCRELNFKHDNLHDNSVVNEGQYPNVYHILLDAHPNAKAMETIGGDLKPFYHELESLGFVTFPESRSNYPGTVWSVSSMLNMSYLENGWSNQKVSFFCNSIQNSKVFKHYQKHGYSILLGTGNKVVSSFYSGYRSFCVFQDSDFGIQLYCILEGTPLKHIYEKIFADFFVRSIRNGLKSLFKALENGRNLYGSMNNVFYAHFLCPHEPCVFGEHKANLAFSGFITKFDVPNFINPEVHKAYCENTYGIDNLALKTIKEIIKQYKNESVKPIIILHSDHSILYTRRTLKNPFITTDTVYGNLLALYVPDAWKKDAENLKFINLYRWIFNHLFGDNFPYFDNNDQMRDF